jgi:hypothetical protein
MIMVVHQDIGVQAEAKTLHHFGEQFAEVLPVRSSRKMARRSLPRPVRCCQAPIRSIRNGLAMRPILSARLQPCQLKKEEM